MTVSLNFPPLKVLLTLKSKKIVGRNSSFFFDSIVSTESHNTIREFVETKSDETDHFLRRNEVPMEMVESEDLMNVYLTRVPSFSSENYQNLAFFSTTFGDSSDFVSGFSERSGERPSNSSNSPSPEFSIKLNLKEYENDDSFLDMTEEEVISRKELLGVIMYDRDKDDLIFHQFAKDFYN